MAAKGVTFMIFMVAIWAVDFAECASVEDCTSLNTKYMYSCLTFIADGSKTSNPDGPCCKGLEVVLKTNATCLCEGFKMSRDMGLKLNLTRAFSLPAVCKVPITGASDCGLSPAGAPGVSPSSPSGGGAAPSTATPTAGDNDGAAPAPSPGNSGASSLTFSVGFLAVYLGLVSFFSF